MFINLFWFLGTVDLEWISRSTAYCSSCRVYGGLNSRGTRYIIIGCDADKHWPISIYIRVYLVKYLILCLWLWV